MNKLNLVGLVVGLVVFLFVAHSAAQATNSFEQKLDQRTQVQSR